jgi:hypothetical protein
MRECKTCEYLRLYLNSKPYCQNEDGEYFNYFVNIKDKCPDWRKRDERERTGEKDT